MSLLSKLCIMCCTKVALQHSDLEKNFEGRATIEDLDDNYKAMIFFFSLIEILHWVCLRFQKEFTLILHNQ